jgi:NAD-dependent dihydropyrimidine dehydrogenase PreA subunit
MKRDIIKIDRDKCTGCGLCVTGCHEGALQIVDGKAVMISELMCDGLGACIGECPEGAIEIESREAAAYDEVLTISKMIDNGKNTVIAHLKHLKDHAQKEYMRQGVEWMLANRDKIPFEVDEVIQAVHGHNPGAMKNSQPQQQPKQIFTAMPNHNHGHGGACGCPGSAERNFEKPQAAPNMVSAQSELTHWPIQMHLINPYAPHFKGSNLLLAADCVAFSLGAFHSDYLKGKTLTIACPKLDSNKESYVEKITALIEEGGIDTLTIMKMEVPCCGGLVQLAKMAADNATRKVPIKVTTVGLQGDILESTWV